MLQHLEQLCNKADGRYATDAELMFFQNYLKTARLRFSLYQKLQKLETHIIQQVLIQLKQTNPKITMLGNSELTAKWERDTTRVFRYAAIALLTDDVDIFKDSVLLWFQTIMKSFKAERSCEETYRVMQIVVREMLSPEEAELFCPLLEMSRTIIGNVRD